MILLKLFRQPINPLDIYSLSPVALLCLILLGLCINIRLDYIVIHNILTESIDLGHNDLDIISLELGTVCDIIEVVLTEYEGVPQLHTILSLEYLKP